MTDKEIKMQHLIALLEEMDEELLQRATDYINGLIDASKKQQEDWWDSLPLSVKKGYEEGMNDIKEGNLISKEDVFRKYRQ